MTKKFTTSSGAVLAADYRALVEGPAAVSLERDVLRAAGPDAISFLQGQLSQDVAALAIGTSAWSLLLQPQGRVDAWLRVTRTDPDAVIIDVDGGSGEAVLARLQRFKLRVKADIDLLDWHCVAIRGPGATTAVSSAPGPGAVVLAAAVWPLVGGIDLLGPAPVAPAGVREVSAEAYEVRRIEAGMPRMGAELNERTIPAEAGVVARSVSFTKGCYTGQELVARIDSRGGHVPRLLRGVVLADLVAPGSSLDIDGRAVGSITSVAPHPGGGAVAIALVHRQVEPPATAQCAGVEASIIVLPG